MIGEMIREWRKEERISQAELAERMHTTQRTIARLERAGNRVRIESLQRAARALGRVVTVIVEGVTNEKNT